MKDKSKQALKHSNKYTTHYQCSALKNTSIRRSDGVNNENGLMENGQAVAMETNHHSNGVINNASHTNGLTKGDLVKVSNGISDFVPGDLIIAEFSSCMWPALVTHVYDDKLKVITLILEQDEIVDKKEVERFDDESQLEIIVSKLTKGEREEFEMASDSLLELKGMSLRARIQSFGSAVDIEECELEENNEDNEMMNGKENSKKEMTGESEMEVEDGKENLSSDNESVIMEQLLSHNEPEIHSPPQPTIDEVPLSEPVESFESLPAQQLIESETDENENKEAEEMKEKDVTKESKKDIEEVNEKDAEEGKEDIEEEKEANDSEIKEVIEQEKEDYKSKEEIEEEKDDYKSKEEIEEEKDDKDEGKVAQPPTAGSSITNNEEALKSEESSIVVVQPKEEDDATIQTMVKFLAPYYADLFTDISQDKIEKQIQCDIQKILPDEQKIILHCQAEPAALTKKGHSGTGLRLQLDHIITRLVSISSNSLLSSLSDIDPEIPPNSPSHTTTGFLYHGMHHKPVVLMSIEDHNPFPVTFLDIFTNSDGKLTKKVEKSEKGAKGPRGWRLSYTITTNSKLKMESTTLKPKKIKPPKPLKTPKVDLDTPEKPNKRRKIDKPVKKAQKTGTLLAVKKQAVLFRIKDIQQTLINPLELIASNIKWSELDKTKRSRYFDLSEEFIELDEDIRTIHCRALDNYVKTKPNLTRLDWLTLPQTKQKKLISEAAEVEGGSDPLMKHNEELLRELLDLESNKKNSKGAVKVKEEVKSKKGCLSEHMHRIEHMCVSCFKLGSDPKSFSTCFTCHGMFHKECLILKETADTEGNDIKKKGKKSKVEKEGTEEKSEKSPDRKDAELKEGKLKLQCSECHLGAVCMLCRSGEGDLVTCSQCPHKYHDSCVRPHMSTQVVSSTSFICPLHVCGSCEARPELSIKALVRCVRCPQAFHPNHIPAGCMKLSKHHMLCYRHYKGFGDTLKPIPQFNKKKKKKSSNLSRPKTGVHVNVPFCFQCTFGGQLVCCDDCPASFHKECAPEDCKPGDESIDNATLLPTQTHDTNLKAGNQHPIYFSGGGKSGKKRKRHTCIDRKRKGKRRVSPTTDAAEHSRNEEGSSKWLCPDCIVGKKAFVGDIIWVKFGAYRWWPSQILDKPDLPQNIKTKSRKPCQFPVVCLGTGEYAWIDMERVYLYEDGDKGASLSSGGVLSQNFNYAMEEARSLHVKSKPLKEALVRETALVTNNEKKPAPFKSIKVNIPYNSAMRELEKLMKLERMPFPCECDASDKCGIESDCINRMLLTECPPSCKWGEDCSNQRFQRRTYPKTKLVKTQGRGWGLIALEDVSPGTLVHEYVGEIIDEMEVSRRLAGYQKSGITDYYMLTVENSRIIDAKPKANNARFMNHSCDPNCETQKWNVCGLTCIGLFANCYIKSGDELTFDYQFDTRGQGKKQCLCGAVNCSGYLGVKAKKLSDTVEEKPEKKGKKRKKIRKAENRQSAAFKAEQVIQAKKQAEERAYQATAKRAERLNKRSVVVSPRTKVFLESAGVDPAQTERESKEGVGGNLAENMGQLSVTEVDDASSLKISVEIKDDHHIMGSFEKTVEEISRGLQIEAEEGGETLEEVPMDLDAGLVI